MFKLHICTHIHFSVGPASGFLKIKQLLLAYYSYILILLQCLCLIICCCCFWLTWVQCSPEVRHFLFQEVANKNLPQQLGIHHISAWGCWSGRLPGALPVELGFPPHGQTLSLYPSHFVCMRGQFEIQKIVYICVHKTLQKIIQLYKIEFNRNIFFLP